MPNPEVLDGTCMRSRVDTCCVPKLGQLSTRFSRILCAETVCHQHESIAPSLKQHLFGKIPLNIIFCMKDLVCALRSKMLLYGQAECCKLPMFQMCDTRIDDGWIRRLLDPGLEP